MIVNYLFSLVDGHFIDVGDVYRPKNKRYVDYRMLTIYKSCDDEFFGLASLSFYIDESNYQQVMRMQIET
jgi:endo-1,4-beta-mannosidase